MKKQHTKPLAQNRKARHDYTIEETVEAGIALKGTEIKSIRRGSANLTDAYAKTYKGEMYVYNMHIAPYEEGNRFNHDPLRTRKLLLHKKEIDKLMGHIQETGNALVPLKLYIKNGVCKVLLGVAKGKKKYDKREDSKRRQMKLEADRAMKDRMR
ncbi:SsrA-binding protein SmpB [Lacicoccus alkaliphilus]|uniref:SsrA-binding protein n=1 Tax=Lacicoccus alkaliphilus DSM 16010 TaxID=1123231 RepID=A0A1M7FCV4_9BACL|nr:SsrA-binding protein SmpB [Salinicoccus alkaliphilus]SHM01891.1 SsrA-binding protein [Salinicoccus alkaliphilus DSM 16010]